MAEKDKKYFWLKLQKDFFKRHDIRIVESMPNGKDYILFYLKLLCESIDHDGNLRFSEEIPYNAEMLATITNTNVDIVRSAVKLFTELKMMEILDDGTYYLSEVNKMLGSESYWAKKKREQRALSGEVGHCPTVSNEIPMCPSKSIEKDIDIDIDKEKDIDTDKEKRERPTDTAQKIIDSFNEICTTLPKVKKLTDARKKVVTARLKEYSEDDILSVFRIAQQSDFLTGRNDKGWQADFDWLMKPSNIVKVLEGNYNNRKQQQQPKPQPQQKKAYNDRPIIPETPVEQLTEEEAAAAKENLMRKLAEQRAQRGVKA